MVLNEVGSRIISSIEKITFRTKIDEKELDAALKEITRTLLSADINAKIVLQVRENVKKKVTDDALPQNVNRKKMINKTVFNELCRIVDPKIQAYKPRKNKTNIIMFVGLQGAGKTTSCCKMANYYRKRGWKTGLVCADTFRPGAFAQLSQNALKTKTAFFGDENEKNECSIAKRGVEYFKEKNFDVIIVDTSGRNKQDEALFAEIKKLEKEIETDHIVLLMDATVGQIASAQAKAFSSTVSIGSVFLSKADSNSKCGGAISGIAETGCPISFIGTGEHMEDIEVFSPEAFVSSMLGMGNVSGLVDRLSSIETEDKKQIEEMVKRQTMTFKDLQTQLKMIEGMGALNSIISMIPNIGTKIKEQELVETEESFRLFTILFSSMTKKEMELDAKAFTKSKSRVMRVVRGSGITMDAFEQLMFFCKKFSSMLKMFGKKKGSLDGLMAQMKGFL